MTPSCHPLAAPGTPSLDLPLLFLAGVTVSLGHCLGMCGPLQAAFVVGARNRGSVLPALLRYHGARILGYTLLGAGLGLLGSSFRLGNAAARLQGGLSLAAGLLMIPVALGLLGLLAPPRWIEFPGLTRRIVGAVHRSPTKNRTARDLALGLANGFLPCGAVAAVAFTALAAAHVAVGALLLLVYGAGTIPILIAAGLVTARIGPRVRARFDRLGAVLVALLGVQLVLRGLAVLDVVPHLNWGSVVFW